MRRFIFNRTCFFHKDMRSEVRRPRVEFQVYINMFEKLTPALDNPESEPPSTIDENRINETFGIAKDLITLYFYIQIKKKGLKDLKKKRNKLWKIYISPRD